MHHEQSTLKKYRVKVGHVQVIVQANSAEEAIDFARRQIALDMPRFYDVIRGLESTRFEVRHAA